MRAGEGAASDTYSGVAEKGRAPHPGGLPRRAAYRADIDGLRAVAVMAVIAFHAFPNSLRGGFAGVDVFFVISGFLISTIILENLDRGTFSFRVFYQRRIRRIFPALALVMLASYAFGWFALLGDEFMQLGKHVAASAGFVSNFALWGEAGYFDNSAETKPLLHLWSLAIEEQFYIVWPLIVFCCWWDRRLMAAMLAVLVATSFTLNATGIATDSVATFFSPLTRAWELLSGGALAWSARTIGRHGGLAAALAAFPLTRTLSAFHVRRHRDALSLLGLMLIVFSFFGLHEGKSFPGFWAIPPVLGAVCTIAAGAGALLNRLVLSHPLMVGVGLISYPLYLWHWPILSFARIVESEVPSVGARLLAIMASVLLAWVTYRAIERPLRHGAHGFAKALMLVVAMVAVGALGLDTYAHDGYATRAMIANYTHNKQELVRTPPTDPACLAFVGTTKPLFPYCRFTDTGAARTVAVIGDSHAHVAYPGVAEFLGARGYNTLMLANSGCPPFIGSPSGANEVETRACQDRIEELLGVVGRHPEIETIIVFTRGTLYLTGTEPVTGDKDVMLGAKLTPAQFLTGLQRTIDQLVAWGKRVYYVIENPELELKSEACMPRPLRAQTRNCRVPVAEVLERQAVYRELIAGLTNVTVIDSIPAFCPDDLCRVVENGMLLYADADHLSLAGSRLQAEKLLSRIFE